MNDLLLEIGADGPDLVLLNGDLARGSALVTAAVVSLWTDGRAGDEDELPDCGESRRGVWHDEPGGRWGSLLWLLDRAKATEETRVRAEAAARDALRWMIEDGIASEIEVSGQWNPGGKLDLTVGIVRGTAARWDAAWNSAFEATFEDASHSLRILPLQ